MDGNEIWILVFVALRGAATLKSRGMKEVWNAAAIIPAEKGIGASSSGITNTNTIINIADNSNNNNIVLDRNFSGELQRGLVQLPREDNLQSLCFRGLLANGCELLKRTRNGN